MKLKITVIALLVALVLAPALSAQAGKFKTLHNFGSSADGNVPSGPLLLDPHGNLYGGTGGGPGLAGNGMVFELSPETNGVWNENILHAFAAGSDGAYPWGGLLLDSSGNVYGTIHGYLSYAVSGIFQLTLSSNSWSNTLLYDVYSGPGLVFDKSGNLYGSMGGGTASLGAVGELSPGSNAWNYTELYSFCPQYGCPDGWSEPAPPIFDRQGNLWGVATYGGINVLPCAHNGSGCGGFAITAAGLGPRSDQLPPFFA